MKLIDEQIAFIEANTQHFDLVIKHGQNFQISHDIAKQVIDIANSLPKYSKPNAPVTDCTGCITDAYQTVWDIYQQTKSKNNDTKK